MADVTFYPIFLEEADIQVLCESLWHSVQRADIPDEDRERMHQLRERLNSLGAEDKS